MIVFNNLGPNVKLIIKTKMELLRNIKNQNITKKIVGQKHDLR